jgi:hypothetical protein
MDDRMIGIQSKDKVSGCGIKQIRSEFNRNSCANPKYTTSEGYYNYFYSYPFIPMYMEGVGDIDPKKEVYLASNQSDLIHLADYDRSIKILAAPLAIPTDGRFVDVSRPNIENRNKLAPDRAIEPDKVNLRSGNPLVVQEKEIIDKAPSKQMALPSNIV